MLCDIFCKVIDNHGDIGVCWRLAVQLATRAHEVRLWVDDDSALAWMAPQGHPGLRVLPWDRRLDWPEPGDLVIEAFGCELPPQFQRRLAEKSRSRGRQPAWINLEYLSAERFARRCHGLPSPVSSGPATGLTKHFFYPGFEPDTGGLLREGDLSKRRAAFDRAAWLRAFRIDVRPGSQLLSLFCYEPAALDQLLTQLASAASPSQLLVTSGRATAAVKKALAARDRADAGWNSAGMLSISWLPLMDQLEFDHLLWSCDFNFVRGEDSLVRALWAGKPFAWQIYPQDDDAHHAKLSSFLEWLDAPPSWREFHWSWNGISERLPLLDGPAWAETAARARERLVVQDDLVTRLLRFIGHEVPA